MVPLGPHWAHDVVATLNQRQQRWFTVATAPCAQLVVSTYPSWGHLGCRPNYDQFTWTWQPFWIWWRPQGDAPGRLDPRSLVHLARRGYLLSVWPHATQNSLFTSKVYRLAGCLAGWLAGWLAGCLAGWLAGWLAAGCLASWLAGSLAGCLAGWLAGWQPGCLASWLADWLARWLPGWVAGWLTAWLSG